MQKKACCLRSADQDPDSTLMFVVIVRFTGMANNRSFYYIGGGGVNVGGIFFTGGMDFRYENIARRSSSFMFT